jgi:putative colanic acid biosynthesis acetyltransferase WcaF
MRMLCWEYVWLLLCVWTPKPFNPWRLFVLRLFGAKLYGTPFVHQRARIALPWNLIMHHRACLGDRANAYSLGEIEIHEGATVAQEVYLCTGTHDFDDPALPLRTAKITIGAHAFIGARAFLLAGVTIGERAVVGACSVVTRDVEASTTVVGNPAGGKKAKHSGDSILISGGHDLFPAEGVVFDETCSDKLFQDNS